MFNISIILFFIVRYFFIKFLVIFFDMYILIKNDIPHLNLGNNSSRAEFRYKVEERVIWQCTSLPPGCTIKTLSAIFLRLGWGRLILMSPLSRRYPCIRTYRVLRERVTIYPCRFFVPPFLFIIRRIIRKFLSPP